MTQIVAYLTFDGNCKEAMTYYKECLGGELVLQTIGESPNTEELPIELRERILHATLIAQDFALMGTDITPNDGLKKGNAISLMLNCSSEAVLRNYFEQLSKGGKVQHPLEQTFYGTLFGGLIDKYNNHWLFNYTKK